ncbi:MAG: glycosyltransferase [Paludibacter sp.]|nr:glycosyltransferase [Paludibacter sp.]
MIHPEKLYGIVIWYFPSKNHIDNIKSYVDNVNKLIVVDNSGENNFSLLSDYDQSKIIYIENSLNHGVATALNQGCKKAVECGAEWVLTVDQDSNFQDDNLFEFIDNANQYTDFETVAIFTPIHFDSRYTNIKPVFENKYLKTNYTMTSGNLLSLNKWKEVGFFLDELFIDWVDEEFCIRICKFKLQIVQINDILLNHFVGDGIGEVKLFKVKKHFDLYQPIRFYYITRNLFIICKLYPTEAKRLKKRWKRLVLKTLKYDNNNKFPKLMFVFRGYIDYLFGKTGAYIIK